MSDWEWKTYGPSEGPAWFQSLPERTRRPLSREWRRLSDLANGGKWFGSREPISPEELDLIRHDLGVWESPRHVLALLESRAYLFIRGLGKVRRAQAIDDVRAVIEREATP